MTGKLGNSWIKMWIQVCYRSPPNVTFMPTLLNHFQFHTNMFSCLPYPLTGILFFFSLICLPSIYLFKTRLKGLSPLEIFLTQSASNDPSILFTQHIGHYSPSSVTHCTFLQLCFVSLFPLLDSGNKKVRVVYFISVFLVLGERYTCN